MDFDIKCFVGENELPSDKLSEIIVDDYVINAIINRVNRRSSLMDDKAVYNG